MKSPLMIPFFVFLALPGACANKPVNVQGCLAFTNQNAHGFVTYVNDEPVTVCDGP